MKTKKTEKEKLFRIISTEYIAGLQYHDYAPGLIPEGDVRVPVKLILEPTNRHDPSAIRIMLGDYKLGYVGAKNGHTKLLMSERQQHGKGTVTGIIIRHDKTAPLWQRLVIQYRSSVKLEGEEL